MAVLAIIEHPDPRLEAPAELVASFGYRTRQLAEDMIETLRALKAAALSAVQVGVHKQLLVIDAPLGHAAPEVYVNPELLMRRNYGLIEERCLSMPGVVTHVLRANDVIVRAQDADGREFERVLSGAPALCLQRKIDLLNARLPAFRQLRLARAPAHGTLEQSHPTA
ncbi:MAG: peptide deformylase [Pseudomonadota bacterium]